MLTWPWLLFLLSSLVAIVVAYFYSKQSRRYDPQKDLQSLIKRCVHPNPFELDAALPTEEEIVQHLIDGIDEVITKERPEYKPGVTIFGHRGPLLYTGYLGITYAFLHIERALSTAKSEKAKGAMHEINIRFGELVHKFGARYVQATRAFVDNEKNFQNPGWSSFFGISAPLYALEALLSNRGAAPLHRRDRPGKDAMKDLIDLGISSATSADYPSEDLLFSRPSFLILLRWLRSRMMIAAASSFSDWGDQLPSDDLVESLMDKIIQRGRRLSSLEKYQFSILPRPPLFYVNFDSELINKFLIHPFIYNFNPVSRFVTKVIVQANLWYLGTDWLQELGCAHGLSGTLFCLLQFPEILKNHPDWFEEVRQSMVFVAKHVDEDGSTWNLCKSTTSKKKNTKEFVHWCRGSPGICLVLCKAYEIFQMKEFLEAAKRCAHHVWEYGLLKKGNGICHGVAGNGYVFLALFRITKEEEYLRKALLFARATWDPRVTKHQRRPDTPYSLFEGMAGTLCFYADCLNPKNSSFPAFETF
eukprot:TRINITY_DN20925_c0_g2_i1.p1 TRINITY_DN20925_c0_g2~~TRINITY_DN20925_c0_g2_i1.p1  ORF type:complete len:530 (+),score=103.53 TRINITY_DN20925_c0_g2_i1:508-2097(+)